MAVGTHPNLGDSQFGHPPADQERQGLLSGSSLPSNGHPSVQPAFSYGDVAWYRRPLVVSAARNAGLIILWYFFSTFLSLWNKLLLGKEHGLFGKGAFPAPFMMSSLQFFTQHLIAKAVLGSGLVKRQSEEPLSWRQYFKTIVPNGLATGLDIGLSNYSLVFITLSFYVMCKSTSVLFLLLFAFIWGIEKPSWSLALVVTIITSGLLLLVAGETKFSLWGFIVVMTAAALSGLRWTITQVLLQGSSHTASAGSPVEVIYQLTPIMGLVMAVISLAFERLWVVLPPSPYFSSISHALLTVGILCVGGVIAFSMVAAEFMLIANTSALTFMVAGTLKEIVTVGSAVLFLHERFTAVNAFGLVVLVSGVVLFNFLKYQKMKQGEIRPVPLDDALECSENGDGVGPPSLLKSKNSGSMVGLPPGGNGGESFPASNGSVRSGSSQLELVAPFGASSRPPSPHTMTEASQRRVVVLQEDEDGSTAPQGSTMWRQHSI